MDRKSREVNKWDFCTVCKRNLRDPCPRCERNRNDRMCWVVLDQINGYRHSHCTFATYKKEQK